MKQSKRKTARILLPLLVAAFALTGCVVYEPIPANGYYVTNSDGTRTFVPTAYSCPVGQTCYYPAGPVTTVPTSYVYPPAYVAPSPYLWAPLFIGLGYSWGHHHHHHGHWRR